MVESGFNPFLWITCILRCRADNGTFANGHTA